MLTPIARPAKAAKKNDSNSSSFASSASRRRPAGARTLAESLEPRLFLDGQNVSVQAGFTSLPAISNIGDYQVPNDFQTTAAGTVFRSTGGTAAPNQTEITGTVTLSWYGGGTIATFTLDNSEWDGGIPATPPAELDSTPVVLNEANAGTILTKGTYRGDYLIIETYSGDANFNPSHVFNATDFATAQSGSLQYVVAAVKFTDSSESLEFLQQPQNTSSGDTIKPPVTIHVLNSNGSLDTDSNDTITLSVASGPGTLGGTATATAVNGVATFSNLSIDAAGTYSLMASDPNATSAVSHTFKIAPDKLVFKKAPHNADVGTALDPGVIVVLEDSKGKIVTTDSTTVISLATIRVTGNAPLTGNTATLVNGVATFTGLTFSQTGTYQLQATDGTDTEATSGKFKISGDKLVILKQPASTDANAPLTLTVGLVDANNKRVTDSTSSVVVSLNIVSGGTNATLAGAKTLQFINGIATFTTTQGLTLNAVGKYTLTATEEDDSTGTRAPTSTTDPVTTKAFTISGFHLVFKKIPKKATVGVAITPAIIVEVENSKNKVITTNSDVIQLTFTLTSGTQTVFTATSVGGIATFTGSTASAVVLAIAGRYTGSATDLTQPLIDGITLVTGASVSLIVV